LARHLLLLFRLLLLFSGEFRSELVGVPLGLYSGLTGSPGRLYPGRFDFLPQGISRWWLCAVVTVEFCRRSAKSLVTEARQSAISFLKSLSRQNVNKLQPIAKASAPAIKYVPARDPSFGR
jgi:hypothetical protein